MKSWEKNTVDFEELAEPEEPADKDCWARFDAVLELGLAKSARPAD